MATERARRDRLLQSIWFDERDPEMRALAEQSRAIQTAEQLRGVNDALKQLIDEEEFRRMAW